MARNHTSHVAMGGKQNVDGTRLMPEEIEDIGLGDIGLGVRISTDD